MIVVLMREQNGIYVGDLMAERLLAEVWPAINEQSQAVGFYQRAATQSCIVWVGRTADLATAAQHRYAHRSGCAKKSDSIHIIKVGGCATRLDRDYCSGYLHF